MEGGVDGVEPVGKHADGLHTLFESGAVGADVDAVGQSADDYHVGCELSQVGHETACELLSVGCRLPSSDDVDHPRCIQVGRAAIVEHERGVVAVAEALRIVGRGEKERGDMVSLVELKFGFGATERFVDILQRGHEAVGCRGQDVADVAAVINDLCGRADGAV